MTLTVHPGSMNRCIVKFKLIVMSGIKGCSAFCGIVVVDVKIIPDNLDFLIGFIAFSQGFHEKPEDPRLCASGRTEP
ncbi:hypothetical protein SINU_11660 [Sporolactobacillus inulinus CASD]|uniref:Uncharacterized protein n=1 Tax=Sporolactobacillus inulinus CASD TaxID=1069536 RepID=A0A0U1QLY6_9BACL|nr:hypothetical protein SINU_11660 [Sporolactobacillus inulinus CASD]